MGKYGNSGWSLSEFSAIIEQQGNERMRAQEQHLVNMQDQLPEILLTIAQASNSELVAMFEVYINKYTSDPREMLIWEQVKDHCRTQLLGRLG